MSDSVLCTVEAGIATVTLNRPRVMNALDPEMIGRLRAVCAAVEADRAARTVVIRGAGPAFLAGGDVAYFQANLPRMAALVPEVAGEFHQAILALRRMPKPVLVAVHGAVAGAGVSLLAAADLGIAADDSRFTMAYSRIGASPDGGATWFLPRLVGTRRALEIMLLADGFDAEAARSLGLVNWVAGVAQFADETARIAQRLARGAGSAFAETKRLVNEGWERPLAGQLDAEAAAFARSAATRDFAEGVTAFVEKRAPDFRGD